MRRGEGSLLLGGLTVGVQGAGFNGEPALFFALRGVWQVKTEYEALYGQSGLQEFAIARKCCNLSVRKL
ncbi:MAG TPA: hypothetical protein DEP53_14690 [Bacteroidetes bacterium]|nr:hypothetical protein [Bacteroidota bacterium]